MSRGATEAKYSDYRRLLWGGEFLSPAISFICPRNTGWSRSTTIPVWAISTEEFRLAHGAEATNVKSNQNVFTYSFDKYWYQCLTRQVTQLQIYNDSTDSSFTQPIIIGQWRFWQVHLYLSDQKCCRLRLLNMTSIASSICTSTLHVKVAEK